MKVEVTEDGMVFSDVFTGIGVQTDQGLFGIAQRDSGIEVLLDGAIVWSSSEISAVTDEDSE